MIGNEDSISFYELHIAVKDYCTFGDNRLIGVSVMQLKDIENQVKIGFVCCFTYIFSHIMSFASTKQTMLVCNMYNFSGFT